MADASIERAVRESGFFSQLPSDYLGELSNLARVVELEANQHLFEQYDRAKDVFVILSGKVSLVICEPKDTCRQIAVQGEGDLVGWSPIVGRTRLSDSAVSLTPVTALAFDGKELMSFAASNPEFGFEFMRMAASTLAERLSGTRLQLLDMCGIHFPEFDVQPESD